MLACPPRLYNSTPGDNYMSGLCIRPNQGGTTEASPHNAGIIIPDLEEHLDFPGTRSYSCQRIYFRRQ